MIFWNWLVISLLFTELFSVSKYPTHSLLQHFKAWNKMHVNQIQMFTWSHVAYQTPCVTLCFLEVFFVVLFSVWLVLLFVCLLLFVFFAIYFVSAFFQHLILLFLLGTFLSANLLGRKSKGKANAVGGWRGFFGNWKVCSFAAGHCTQSNSLWKQSMLIQLWYILIWIKYMCPTSIFMIWRLFVGLLCTTSIVAVMVCCTCVLLFSCAFPLSVHSSLILLVCFLGRVK